jgi:predicted kinase
VSAPATLTETHISVLMEGIYRPEMTDRTYETMLERARTALELGEPVVLDGSWSDSRWRSVAASLASDTLSDLVELCCVAPAEAAAARIRARESAEVDPSDATPAVAAAMAEEMDAWPSAAGIDTSGTPEQSLSNASAALARALSSAP